MSITGMMNTALTGLFTNQAAMKTLSNNIANVNTPGYSRQVTRRENIIIAGESAGVRISAVERVVDNFLVAAGFDATADAKGTGLQKEFHDRLQGLLGRPDSNTTLSARVDQLFQSFGDLALNPSDKIVRQASLEKLTDLGIEISRLHGSIQDLRNDTNLRMAEEVIKVNEAIKRIHRLNPLIVRQKSLGTETAGMESQRDQALTDISSSIDIKTRVDDTGLMTISTKSGATLLDLSRRELEYLAPGVVLSDTRFEPIKIHRIDNANGERIGSSSELDKDLSSGRIKGLIDLRDQDLKNISNTLGELAANLKDQFNAVHNAHTAVPAPNSLTGEATAVASAHPPGFSGIVTFGIVDSSNNVVSKTTVDFDSAAPADYTALVAQVNAGLGGNGTLAFTNGVMSFTAAAGSHGVAIVDDDTSPSDRGGRGFSHFFGMNNLVESQEDGIYKTGLAGTEAHNLVAGGQATYEIRDKNNTLLKQYTYNVGGTSFDDILTDLNNSSNLGGFIQFSLDSNGKLIQTEQSGFNGLQLSVVSDTTNINNSGLSISNLFGLGERHQVDPAKDFKLIESIDLDAAKMALAKFDATASVGSSGLSLGDQSGALAFQDLQTKLIDFEAAGELGLMNVNLAQYSAALLANAGLMGNRTNTREEDANALLLEINSRIADVSGVNLDEELANMVVLQNSFAAAARLISASDEMMDTLLNTFT